MKRLRMVSSPDRNRCNSLGFIITADTGVSGGECQLYKAKNWLSKFFPQAQRF
jgi:hypothetical protein